MRSPTRGQGQSHWPVGWGEHGPLPTAKCVARTAGGTAGCRALAGDRHSFVPAAGARLPWTRPLLPGRARRASCGPASPHHRPICPTRNAAPAIWSHDTHMLRMRQQDLWARRSANMRFLAQCILSDLTKRGCGVCASRSIQPMLSGQVDAFGAVDATNAGIAGSAVNARPHVGCRPRRAALLRQRAAAPTPRLAAPRPLRAAAPILPPPHLHTAPAHAGS